MNIRIALPYNDFYNGVWEDVILHEVPNKDYVGVELFPELDKGDDNSIRHFPRKYVTIMAPKKIRSTKLKTEFTVCGYCIVTVETRDDVCDDCQDAMWDAFMKKLARHQKIQWQEK